MELHIEHCTRSVSICTLWHSAFGNFTLPKANSSVREEVVAMAPWWRIMLARREAMFALHGRQAGRLFTSTGGPSLSTAAGMSDWPDKDPGRLKISAIIIATSYPPLVREQVRSPEEFSSYHVLDRSNTCNKNCGLQNNYKTPHLGASTFLLADCSRL